jgi:tRNA A-37 threonylcarbamoyl transferase component Bud32
MKSEIVYPESGNVVHKKCLSEKAFQNELRIYHLGLKFLPKLISAEDDNTLVIERIEGENLNTEQDLDFVLFAEMYSLLHTATFNSQKVICQIDTNPRNFIIRKSDSKYFMIDFSESDYSYPETDLVNFLLFWASCYKPERFSSVLPTFLNSYPAKYLLSKRNRVDIEDLIRKFDSRRKLFRKTPCLNRKWQDENRELLKTKFYDQLLI